jgi:hypothetical protein
MCVRTAERVALRRESQNRGAILSGQPSDLVLEPENIDRDCNLNCQPSTVVILRVTTDVTNKVTKTVAFAAGLSRTFAYVQTRNSHATVRFFGDFTCISGIRTLVR